MHQLRPKARGATHDGVYAAHASEGGAEDEWKADKCIKEELEIGCEVGHSTTTSAAKAAVVACEVRESRTELAISTALGRIGE